MNKLPLVVLLLTALFAGLPPAVADDQAPKEIDSIKAEAVTRYVAENQNALIIDVRTPQEYEISHVPGAVNINVADESFTEMISQLDSDKTYIVYCTKNPVGGRSMTALAKMEAMGFKDLLSLEGGHVAWTEAELPMTRKDEE